MFIRALLDAVMQADLDFSDAKDEADLLKKILVPEEESDD